MTIRTYVWIKTVNKLFAPYSYLNKYDFTCLLYEKDNHRLSIFVQALVKWSPERTTRFMKAAENEADSQTKVDEILLRKSKTV